MPFINKLLMPQKLLIAGWIMAAALIIAMAFQYVTGMQTIRFVVTVFYYLLLDYVWTSVKRELASDTQED